MARNYAPLLHEYLEEMDILSDAEFGRLCRALLKYSMAGEEGRLEGAEKVLWKRVKNQEDRFQASYRELTEAKRDAGKRGAQKRWRSMADDGTAMADDGKNGYTKTNTETNTLPPNGGKGTRAGKQRPVQEGWGFGPELTAALTDWLSYKQEKWDGYKPTGLKSLVTQVKNKAEKYGETAVAGLIRQCMSSNYRGIIWDKLEQPQNETWRSAQKRDFQPSAERIQKSNEELDRFLAELEAKGGGQI